MYSREKDTAITAMAGYTTQILIQEEAAERRQKVLHNDKKKILMILHDIRIKKIHF